jgi:hypothetical protein
MSPELKNSKNIVQQQLPVVKFPINVREDLLPHGEHDSSLKFVLIPLLHEKKKQGAEMNYNTLDSGFHCEAWGSKCHCEACRAKWLPYPCGIHYEARGLKLIVSIALTPGAIKSGMQGVYSMNLEYIKCSIIPAEYS